ncbi:MAG: NADH-quinone oxidoreductase subunit NuoE [Desulfosarcinaceae bacterium]|jgi:NADH-quinone oxidoreductase subunit E
MLTPQEIEEIEAEIPKYEQRRAVSVEALKIVQRHRGWVSDAALAEVARLLGMAAADLDAVATFYNLIYRMPVGRHVILVCNSVSCWVMGCETVFRHLGRRLGIGLGETTADGRFTLLPVVCLGACHQGPAMMVDDDLHVHLDPDRIDEILDAYG